MSLYSTSVLQVFDIWPMVNTSEQEIEKTEDPKTLWSLLMPWELGKRESMYDIGDRALIAIYHRPLLA